MATFEKDGPFHNNNKGGNDQFNLNSVVSNIWFGFNNNPVHRLRTEKYKTTQQFSNHTFLSTTDNVVREEST